MSLSFCFGVPLRLSLGGHHEVAMKLATWAALGAGATVTSALVSASAILYRGSLFTEEGTSKVVSFFLLNRGKGKGGLRDVEAPPAAATKGSAKPR